MKVHNTLSNHFETMYINLAKLEYAIIDTLNAKNAIIETVVVSDLDVKDLSASDANIDYLSVQNADVINLNTTYAIIDNLSSSNATINNLMSTNGTIDNLTSVNAVINDLTSTSATIDNLTSVNAVINNLTSTDGAIDNLTSINGIIQNGTIANLDTVNGSIDNLTSATSTINLANINILNAETADIQNLDIQDLKTNDIVATNGTITNLTSTNATITNLISSTGNIDTFETEIESVTNYLQFTVSNDAQNVNLRRLIVKNIDIVYPSDNFGDISKSLNSTYFKQGPGDDTYLHTLNSITATQFFDFVFFRMDFYARIDNNAERGDDNYFTLRMSNLGMPRPSSNSKIYFSSYAQIQNAGYGGNSITWTFEPSIVTDPNDSSLKTIKVDCVGIDYTSRAAFLAAQIAGAELAGYELVNPFTGAAATAAKISILEGILASTARDANISTLGDDTKITKFILCVIYRTQSV